MDMEMVWNLGYPVETITIERLSKGGYVILGTPQLTFEEMNEVLGVIHHQIEVGK